MNLIATIALLCGLTPNAQISQQEILVCQKSYIACIQKSKSTKETEKLIGCILDRNIVTGEMK